ncbi:MAG: hypothetical protein KDB22_08400, partial [Planctomycetales bacterium]|nr:hypothetical protein [Planctomycetales bacterium]
MSAPAMNIEQRVTVSLALQRYLRAVERFEAAECENQYAADCECEICLSLLELDPTAYIQSKFRRDSIENLPIPSGPPKPVELKIEISPEQLREIQAHSDAMADRARTAGRASEV